MYLIQSVFSYFTDKRRPDVLVSFIRLSKGYYHCDHLSSSRHRLLNLPDTQRTTQRWRRVGRRVEPALIGQVGKKNTLYISATFVPNIFRSDQHLSNYIPEVFKIPCRWSFKVSAFPVIFHQRNCYLST